jgi:hypothetical protein
MLGGSQHSVEALAKRKISHPGKEMSSIVLETAISYTD